MHKLYYILCTYVLSDKKMGKIKLEKKVGIHVLITPELDKWISETAYKMQKTRTEIITTALIWYLSEVNPKPGIVEEEKKEE